MYNNFVGSLYTFVLLLSCCKLTISTIEKCLSDILSVHMFAF